MKKKWYFLMGFATALIIMPFITSLGIPRYADFLKATFGDFKLLAGIFSLSVLVFLGVLLMDMKENVKQGD